MNCPPGTYGPSCSKKCQCKKGLTCDSASGECSEKCQPGYTGPKCDLGTVLNNFILNTKSVLF